MKFCRRGVRDELGNFLSSTVIASIVSVLITYITFKRTEENKYITGERKEWREKMRDISSELHGASYEKTLFLLTELKVRIKLHGGIALIKSVIPFLRILIYGK